MKRLQKGVNVSEPFTEFGFALSETLFELFKRSDGRVRETRGRHFAGNLMCKIASGGRIASVHERFNNFETTTRGILGKLRAGECRPCTTKVSHPRIDLTFCHEQPTCSPFGASCFQRATTVIEEGNAVRKVHVRDSKIAELDRAVTEIVFDSCQRLGIRNVVRDIPKFVEEVLSFCVTTIVEKESTFDHACREKHLRIAMLFEDLAAKPKKFVSFVASLNLIKDHRFREVDDGAIERRRGEPVQALFGGLYGCECVIKTSEIPQCMRSFFPSRRAQLSEYHGRVSGCRQRLGNRRRDVRQRQRVGGHPLGAIPDLLDQLLHRGAAAQFRRGGEGAPFFGRGRSEQAGHDVLDAFALALEASRGLQELAHPLRLAVTVRVQIDHVVGGEAVAAGAA